MKSARVAGVAALAFGVLGVAGAHDLTIGDVAPPMSVVGWVKGKPIPRFEKGQVYVVEFWATWCGPCKQSIPHLTELAHKYAGKANFIGVDVFDQASEPTDLSYVKKVKAFVDGKGSAMDYRVAVDGPASAMANGWLKAYGENGIPSAFVVNGDGVVAWIGHPMEGLDGALDRVLSPGYDLAVAAQERVLAKRAAEAALPLPQRFMARLQAKDWSGARALSDQLLASDPKTAETYAGARFTVLLHTDPADAYDYAQKLRTGIYRNIAPALTGLARTIVEEPGLEKRDLDLALSLAQDSVERSHGGEPRFLETLAIVQAARGENAAAVETMTKTVALAEKSSSINGVLLKEMRDRLATYRAKS